MSDNTVTIVGLGPMGSALAAAMLGAGVETTVWNRSPGPAQALAADGAHVAPDIADTFAASDLVVVCLRDHEAVRDVLGKVPADALTGTVVVNLTSATPQESRATAAWAADRGMTYSSGAIMVPTPMVGKPEALILHSGPEGLFRSIEDRLAPLAGQHTHLGEDHGLASLYDMSMLDVFFAGMTSFLHAAAMMRAEGVTAAAFTPYATEVLGVLEGLLPALAGDVDADSYPGTEDRLSMDLAGLEHVVATSRAAGVDPALPALLRDLAQKAVDAGHGDDGYSRVVTQLRA